MIKSSGAALPEPGEGKRGEGGHIGYLLRQAAAGQHLRMERALADLGVTPPQFVVLTMLAAYPGHSNADLARLALLTPQTVSVIVANLKKASLVEARPHASHGRIVQLQLSAKGEDLLTQSKARVRELEARMLEGLSAVEERTIRRWLARQAAGQD